MNILKRELKAGLKPFLFWTLGLFFLVFTGIVKSTGVASGTEGITALTEAFPPIVKAVFGIAGVDIGTFGGFYAVLAQYSMILVAVYAVYLGSGAISREAVDKTYEFVFTKPRSRSFILSRKLLAGFMYLTIFCVLNFVFSVTAAAKLENVGDMTATIGLFAAAAWLVGILFFSLAALFAAVSTSAERGSKLGNSAVLVAYAVGVAYDMMDNGALLRLLSPFKYFSNSELLANELNLPFAALCVGIAVVSLAVAFRSFERRDLSAL